MEYITAIEAAAKCGVSLRQVQRLLAASRIPGAKKYGHTYLVPADAEKPADPRIDRLERGEPYHINKGKNLSRELAEVHAALSHIHTPLDNPDAILSQARDEHLRILLEMWLAYPRGNFERVKHLYNGITDNGAVRLIASGTAIAASISLGDYPFFLEVETYLKNIVKAGISADVTAYAEFMLAIAYNGMSVPNMLPDWLKNGDFRALPELVKPTAAFIRVQYISQQKNPEALFAAAQANLALCATEHALNDPDTYLRIHCAEACIALGRESDAISYLRSAMQKSLRHGFITPFAERLVQLSGLCERLLEREFPLSYDAVTGQFERVTKNWVIFHNRYTQDNITHILSLRDHQIAQLVTRGTPYKKIAEQFGFAPGTVKNKMDVVYEKLGISGSMRKKELAKFFF